MLITSNAIHNNFYYFIFYTMQTIERHKRCLTTLHVQTFSCFRNPKVTVFITFNCCFFCSIFLFLSALLVQRWWWTEDGYGCLEHVHCLSTIKYLFLRRRCRRHILFHKMKFNIIFSTLFLVDNRFFLLAKLIEWKCRFQCENLICNFSHYYYYLYILEKKTEVNTENTVCTILRFVFLRFLFDIHSIVHLTYFISLCLCHFHL